MGEREFRAVIGYRAVVMSYLLIAFFHSGNSGLRVERFEVPTTQCERVGQASVDFLKKSNKLWYVDYTCIPKEQ